MEPEVLRRRSNASCRCADHLKCRVDFMMLPVRCDGCQLLERHAQGSKAGAKPAAATGRSVLDMLARGHGSSAGEAVPVASADSPPLAPATAPQHSRQAPSRAAAAAAAAAAAENDSEAQPDADLALQPKRLFSSQTADHGVTAADGDAAQPRQASGSRASTDGGPAVDGAQQPRMNDCGGKPLSTAVSRKPLAQGSAVSGRRSGQKPDEDVIDLVTPPTLAEPGFGRDGDGGLRAIILSLLSTSSSSEQRTEVLVTPPETPGSHPVESAAAAAAAAAAAMASSRLMTNPSTTGGGSTPVEALPHAAARSPSHTFVQIRQGNPQRTDTAACSSPAVVDSTAARTCVGTLDMTQIDGARWLSDNASPFSDIVIDLDTPSTAPASGCTPAVAGRVGGHGGRSGRTILPDNCLKVSNDSQGCLTT